MPSIFESLPGIPLPISEISKNLGDMWKGEANSASAAPSEFRASQLNLIIHFGLETTVDEANELFGTAIHFTQRHPGRIIILCPTVSKERLKALDGKLFTQCYIGESQREMCCCEALLLQYSPNEPQSLFNQVSIWLESDLPVYHWFHRFPVLNVKNKYLSFVKNSKRVLFDSQVEKDDYSEIPTPDEWRIRDLADARILPVKQSIGQILSTFEEKAIISGLDRITLKCAFSEQAGAHQLKIWLQQCLSETNGFKEATRFEIEIVELPKEDALFEIKFEYSNDQSFYWAMSRSGNCAETKAFIDGRKSEHNVILRKNDPETVLSEAIFFGR